MASTLCSLLRADWGWGYTKRCIVYARLVTSTDGRLSTVIISVVGHQTTLKATPAVDDEKMLGASYDYTTKRRLQWHVPILLSILDIEA